MSPIWSTTYFLSISILSDFLSDAAKLISSRIFSKIVWSLLAPIFSTSSLTLVAIEATSDIASSEKFRFTPSVEMSSTYCFIRLFSGSFNILIKSSFPNAFSSTLLGRRPCNSGSKSEGLATWNAPEAINKIWSVLTDPYFVETVEPSIRGSKSLCTPSLLTSA